MTEKELQKFYNGNKENLLDIRSWPECSPAIITLHDFIKMVRTVELDE